MGRSGHENHGTPAARPLPHKQPEGPREQLGPGVAFQDSCRKLGTSFYWPSWAAAEGGPCSPHCPLACGTCPSPLPGSHSLRGLAWSAGGPGLQPAALCPAPGAGAGAAAAAPGGGIQLHKQIHLQSGHVTGTCPAWATAHCWTPHWRSHSGCCSEGFLHRGRSSGDPGPDFSSQL